MGKDIKAIAYHGTPKAFATLRESASGGRFPSLNVPHDGIWFTEDFGEAKAYALLRGRARNNRVIKVSLRFKNPYVYTAEEYANEGIAEAPDLSVLKRNGYDGLVVERGKWEIVNHEWLLIVKPTHYAAFYPHTFEVLSNERV